PYVSALPPGTTININTANVPVLMTMSSVAPITQQTAQAIWQQGHASYTSIADIGKIAPSLSIDCGGSAAAASTCFGFQSSYFLAQGEITLDQLPFTFYSLIERRA